MSSSQEVAGTSDAGLSSTLAPPVVAQPDSGAETIRNLLRKLEEAAAELPKDQTPVKQEPALATLSARGSKNDGNATAIASRPSTIELPLPSSVGKESTAGSVQRKFAMTVGVASFGLGAAAAGLAIVALGLKPFSTTPTKPNVPAPLTVASSPADANNTSSASTSKAQPADKPASAAASEPSSITTVTLPSPTATEAPSQPKSATPAAVAQPNLILSSLKEILVRPGTQMSLDLPLSRSVTEKDRLLIVFRDVPAWLTLSKGSTIRDGLWLLPAHQAADLTIEASEAAKGSADIEIALARLDGQILSKSNLGVKVQSVSNGQSQIATVRQQSTYSADQVLARGQLLLDTGEIEAGRTLLRAAAEGGSVTAALKLAQTYDPAETERLGLSRNSADTSLAMRWYERAQAMGSQVAAARLSALTAPQR